MRSPRNKIARWFVPLAIFGALAFSNTAKGEEGLSFAVIAHSVSTRMKAREVLRRQAWTETTNLRLADGILVVCRSGLSWPLNSSYDSFKELNEAAASQLNIGGSEFRRVSETMTQTADQLHYTMG